MKRLALVSCAVVFVLAVSAVIVVGLTPGKNDGKEVVLAAVKDAYTFGSQQGEQGCKDLEQEIFRHLENEPNAFAERAREVNFFLYRACMKGARDRLVGIWDLPRVLDMVRKDLEKQDRERSNPDGKVSI